MSDYLEQKAVLATVQDIERLANQIQQIAQSIYKVVDADAYLAERFKGTSQVREELRRIKRQLDEI